MLDKGNLLHRVIEAFGGWATPAALIDTNSSDDVADRSR
jgi:hypothetical protein